MTGMEAKQEFVDEQKIKEILIAIRDTEDHFDILIKGVRPNVV